MMTIRLGRVVLGVLAAATLYGQLAAAQNNVKLDADPADLAGERVRPSDTVRDVSANEGAVALWQSLMKLRTRASLMMIVAHPDDEDGGMLTYESRGHGVRTAMLTLTRGEGGQNIMSGDFDGALGLVRTQELLAADRYMGVDQMWGTEIDFGFSKTKEEALANWGHERVLYDAVRAVRLYRPLVVTAVFIGGITDGHGQHQVSGEIAQEIFDAAGDPKVFPEMGLEPWSPLKVYGRVPFFSVTAKGMYDYATGKYAPAKFYNYVTKTWSTEEPKANVVIPEGEYSPVLGMSYLQFARLGLGQQKTQNGGMGVPAAGPFEVPYHRYGSRVAAGEHESDFFAGLDTSLTGMASLAPGEKTFLRQGLAQMDAAVRAATAAYAVNEPEKTAPALRDGLRTTEELLVKVAASDLSVREKFDLAHELRVKRVQFNDALVEALGLRVRAQVAPQQAASGPFARFQDAESSTTVTPGQSFAVQVQVVNGGRVPVTVKDVSLRSSGYVLASAASAAAAFQALPGEKRRLGEHGLLQERLPVDLPADAPATRPYFAQPSPQQSFYDVTDPRLRNASVTPYPLTAMVSVDFDGVPIELGQIVQTAQRVTGFGVVYEPLVVAPAISVSVSPAAGIVPLTEQSLVVAAHLHSNVKGVAKGSVHLELPSGWKCVPERADFSLAKDGDETTVSFTVAPGKLQEIEYRMTAVAEFGGKEYREGYKTVGYAGMRPTNLFRAAAYRARGVDVKVAPGIRVGYLPGTGDEVQASLENIGIHAKTLSVGDLGGTASRDLDVIVLGVRAYAAHPDLAAANQRLLDFAKAGGVVIVQYNRDQYDHDFGPFPYSLHDEEKVVDEHADVHLLEPENPLLTWPNRITEQDFAGWVEERGHGFMTTWDAHYTALTETHDPDQDPQKGGLLYARTGRGAYVYVAFALYRQLPEGVPGAYRIFANLLSLGRNTAAR